MTHTTIKTRRIRRHHKVRSRVNGTAQRPRLCVFRSNKYLYAQLVDDDAGKTLLGMSDRGMTKKKATKKERSHLLGEAMAKKAAELRITKVVFDRGGYAYHGRTQGLAEGARAGGLEF